MTGRRVLAAFLGALLLAGTGAFAAAGATDERPPTKLWSEFPLVPTTTSAPPATPPVSRARPISRPTAATAARVVDTDDMSLFIVAGIAFGFAAAGTAFAIAIFTGVQALRRRPWVEDTGEAEESPEPAAPRPAPAPTAPATPPPPPATPVLVDVAPALAAPATPPPPPAPPVLIDVLQPSARLFEPTGEPEEPPKPSAPPRPAPAPAAPAPASPATPAPAAPATPRVDALQPSARLSPAPPAAQQEELVVALWRGSVKSRFCATSIDPDGTETTVAASPFFRPERELPVEESVAARAAHSDLTRELAELGWEPVKTDETFANLFRRQSSATGAGGTESPDGSGRNQNA